MIFVEGVMLHCYLKVFFSLFFLNDFCWRCNVALLFKIWSHLTPSSPFSLSLLLQRHIIIR